MQFSWGCDGPTKENENDKTLCKFYDYAKQNNTPVFFVAGAFKFIFCIRTRAILWYKRPQKKSNNTLPDDPEHGGYQIKN